MLPRFRYGGTDLVPKQVARSCAQQRITLRFVPGIIASRQFAPPLRQYIFQKHITILKHTSR